MRTKFSMILIKDRFTINMELRDSIEDQEALNKVFEKIKHRHSQYVLWRRQIRRLPSKANAKSQADEKEARHYFGRRL